MGNNTSKTHVRSVKRVREDFKKRGVYYTDEALAELLKSFVPADAQEVYDPTCGGGALLAVFGDDVAKYGQEIDTESAEMTSRGLTNCIIAAGDTLTSPAWAWTEKRFRAIVANPPFSTPWEPDLAEGDERFKDAPCLAPRSKADYAFMLHCLYMLEDDGVAAILEFPGVLYRGGREGKIRQWLVEQNVIDRVVYVPGGHFEDTKIATCVIVLRKGRTEDYVTMENMENGLMRDVPIAEIAENGYTLNVQTYVQEPKPEREPVDVTALESKARAGALQRIEAEINFSAAVAELEGWSIEPFLDDIVALTNRHRV